MRADDSRIVHYVEHRQNVLTTAADIDLGQGLKPLSPIDRAIAVQERDILAVRVDANLA